MSMTFLAVAAALPDALPAGLGVLLALCCNVEATLFATVDVTAVAVGVCMIDTEEGKVWSLAAFCEAGLEAVEAVLVRLKKQDKVNLLKSFDIRSGEV